MKNRKSFAFSLILVLLALTTLLASCGEGHYYEPHQYQTEKKKHPETPDVSFPVENRLSENEWVLSAEEPVSTFSADVDTASYTEFRKLVNDGVTLAELQSEYAGWFRTEEMINFFDYGYAGPAREEDLFGVTQTVMSCPWNAEKAVLVMGFAAEKELKTPLAGNNYVFLIDVSGSMASSDKLPLLQKAMCKLVDRLGPDDLVSIVTYASKEKVVADGLSAGDAAELKKAINSLRASGSTNGEKGIQTAYEIAQKHFIEGGNNRILMASDGDLNVGISDPEELKNFISEKKKTGVYLSVLGFGSGNFRDSMMEALADNGNGAYYYVDSEEEADRIFGKSLDGTLVTLAEDVKFQLTFDPQYVDGYRLIGYENRLLSEEDFTDDTKDAGEVGLGHRLTVLYELQLKLPRDTDVDLANLAIRWKNPGEDESCLQELAVTSATVTAAPAEDAVFAAAVAHAALILRDSENVRTNGKLDDVISTLKALKNTAEDRVEFLNLLQAIRNPNVPRSKTTGAVGGITYYD